MNSWNGKSVLVTGGTGMVGSWLIKRLVSEGAQVTNLVLDHDPQSEYFRSGVANLCTAISGDLRSRYDVSRALHQNSVEVVFHLGAQTIVGQAFKDPISTFETNILGTWNLFEAIRQSNGQVKAVLVASSDKAYGEAKTLPYDEATPLQGSGPYDVSKSCTDLIAQSYFATYGVPTIIARCGNIYGGGDLNWSRIVPGTIRALIEGKRPIIRSNGKFLRDYIYVEDAVDAYLNMANAAYSQEHLGEAFNFSREEPIDVLGIYKEICDVVLGEYVEPEILDSAKNEIVDQFLDSTKARSILRWESNYSLTVGLRETLAWYRKFLSNAA